MKKCGCCKTIKSDDEFFNTREAQSHAGEAYQESGYKVGEYCKQCHAEGKIKYGYGWFKGKFQSPDDTVKTIG